MTRTLAALALAFAALGVLELSWLHLLRPLDHRLLDAFVRAQAAKLEPDPEIVVVNIDDPSFARMEEVAGMWPWPRSVHAELLNGLAAQKPKAIVFDIFFSERDQFRPDADAFFVETLKQLQRVYLPSQLLDLTDAAKGLRLADLKTPLQLEAGDKANPEARVALLPPLIVPPELWNTGFINFLEDEDGVGRRYYLSLDVEGWKLPSLPARVARDLGYPVNGEELLLHWRGDARGHRHISYADLYEDFGRRQRQRPADEFKDKIVIIGTDAPGLHDLRATPLAPKYPGVEILATAIDNLKNGRHMQRAPDWLPSLLLLVLIAGLTKLAQRPLQAGALLVAVTVTTLLGSAYAVSLDWLVPVLTPLIFGVAFFLSIALLVYLQERERREQAVRMFSRFLNPTVVNRLVERGATIESLSGQSRAVSVLFSDIRGFTTLSETRPPEEVIDILNRYFSRQVAVVFKHGGTLDKFIGDCIMAFWGAPLDDGKHAQHAVAAALEMQDVVLQFKEELRAEVPDFDVGIGIHSGKAVASFVGAEQKMEYTVIGDTVNLASRIEGLTKDAQVRICVSADTAQACGAVFDFTARGSYKVKGRSQPVELFEPSNKTGSET